MISPISLHNLYNDSDDVIVGDGSSLSISDIGSFTLHSSHFIIKFNNVLVVPHISHSIISVSQFSRDNNAYAEFFPSYQGHHDKTTLLHGTSDCGVYLWKPSSPQVLLVVSESMNSWHHRLGHPAPPIISFLKKQFSLVIPFCRFTNGNACDINKIHKPFLRFFSCL